MSTIEIAGRARAAMETWDRAPLPPSVSAPAATVLVGGAGLLGSRIAAQLLDDPDDTPLVIVSRDPDAVEARWAEFAGPGRAARWMRDPRLVRVAADIAALDDGWTARVPRSGVVIHLAAVMHAVAGWQAMAPVNLGGLRSSVRLSRRDGALLQLASTLSVLASSNAAAADREEALPEQAGLWLAGGYAQTKAAAEFALAVTDLRWQVIRYGLLVPEPGLRFPAGHFAPAFLDAMRRVGSVPLDAEQAEMDLTPVDGAAAASIRLARRGTAGWQHWANGTAATLSETLAAIEATLGSLPRLPTPAWLSRLRFLPPVARTLLRAAFDKSGFLREDAAVRPVLNVDLFQSTHRRFLPSGPQQLGAPASPALLLPGLVGSMLRSLEKTEVRHG